MCPSSGGSTTNTRRKARRCPRRVRLPGLLAVALLLFAGSSGASDPEIVRVRVPASEVSKWFPAGTELRVMPPDQFETLVRRAIAGSSREPAPLAPRLVRARHRARWESGVLSGHTELLIEAAASGPADFVLEPWTPAILPMPQTAQKLGAQDSGKPSLWIAEGPAQTINLDWEQRPRSLARGSSFTLGLPGDETTVLALEVPKQWIPAAERGQPARPATGRDAGMEPLGIRSRVGSNRASAL